MDMYWLILTKMENTCKFDCFILTWVFLAAFNLCTEIENCEEISFTKPGFVLFIGTQISLLD